MKTLNSSNLFLALGASLAIAALATPATGHAATITAKWKSNAAGVCQGSLPAFAGTLRARPLAVQNEGTGTAFVTCSLPYDDEINNEEPTSVGIRLINNTATTTSVTCTMVSGTNASNANYVEKILPVAANGGQNFIFTVQDLPDNPETITAPNFLCALPPGIGVNYVYYFYARQVGT